MSGDLRVVSASEISDAMQCPHKWDLAWQQRWRQPDADQASHAQAGTDWHAVLDTHYTAVRDLRAKHPGVMRGHVGFVLPADDVISRLASDNWHVWRTSLAGGPVWDRVSATIQDTADPELQLWMYRGYLARYGYDQHWKVLHTERKLDQLPFGAGLLLKARIDLVIEVYVAGRPTRWVVDHKSHKTLPDDKELEFDVQLPLYSWALNEAGEGPIHGAIHNLARRERTQADRGVIRYRKDGKPYSGQEPTPLDRRFRRQLIRWDARGAFLQNAADDAYQAMFGRIRPGATQPRHPNPETCRRRCDYSTACLWGRTMGHEAELDHLRSNGYIQDHTRH